MNGDEMARHDEGDTGSGGESSNLTETGCAQRHGPQAYLKNADPRRRGPIRSIGRGGALGLPEKRSGNPFHQIFFAAFFSERAPELSASLAIERACFIPFSTCFSTALRACFTAGSAAFLNALIFGAAAFFSALIFGAAAFPAASYASTLFFATVFATFFAAFWMSFVWTM